MSKFLKALRNLKGYTQDDVAKAVGISLRSYLVKENNVEKFTLGEITKLAEFLEVEPKIFFEENITFKAN